MAPIFAWNPRKAAANNAKHGVSFDEAATIFMDPLARIFDDIWNAGGEVRQIAIGHSASQRLLVVCYREVNSTLRIISARRATRTERADYEEETGD